MSTTSDVSGAFEICRDELLEEEVWLARTPAGLPVRVVPSQRVAETVAVVAFRYGSTDLGFESAGVRHQSPEGVAHYLEHKLFEDEEIQAFDRFARRGARVNAMTSFTKTSYHFSATSRVGENLTDLLHLVSHAHITDENVEKERGIIAQEIRMYEDSADYRLFFDYLGCLYGENPVRHPVGGTVESIAGISAAELLTCYEAFYRSGNGGLAVAGPVDPHEILELAAACELGAGDAPASIWAEDLGPVLAPRHSRQMEVPRAQVMCGFKDLALTEDAEERLLQQLTTEVLFDRLFSPASEIRESLQHRGCIDDSFSTSYMADSSFGFSVLTGETDDAEATVAALRETLAQPPAIGDEYLDRVRRKFFGKYVRAFASMRNLAFSQVHESLDRVPPFRALARLQAVTAEDVLDRQRRHCVDSAFAVAVITP